MSETSLFTKLKIMDYNMNQINYEDRRNNKWL